MWLDIWGFSRKSTRVCNINQPVGYDVLLPQQLVICEHI